MLLKRKKSKTKLTLIKNPDFYGIPAEFGNVKGKEYLTREEKVIIQTKFLASLTQGVQIRAFTINPN